MYIYIYYAPCLQVLEVISNWNFLRLGRAQEVLHDGVRVVAERNLDWAFEAMHIPVVACALVCLMLLHERKKVLGLPALCLEVIVVGG